MGRRPRDIFLIDAGGSRLVYAPLHGVTAVVNASAGDALRAALDRGDLAGLPAALAPLGERLAAAPAEPPRPPTGPFAPKRVNLLTTSACNLRCVYCSPPGDGDEALAMSPRTAAAAIDYQADVAARDGLKALAIYFFGGEPLLPAELVRFAVDHARGRAQRLGLPLVATATTNGVMPPDMAAWAAENLRMAIVSLDGPPAVHDAQRPAADGAGTFAAVERTLRIFEAGGLPYALRCTVGAEAAPRLGEIAELFCQRFRPRAVAFEPTLPAGRCGRAPLDPPPPAELIRGLAAAEAALDRHGVRLKLTMADPHRLARTNCGVAADQLVVTPDGLATACFAADSRRSPHAGPMAIGEVRRGRLEIDPAGVAAARSLGVESVPACRECFCKWHCAGGCRVYHSPPGAQPAAAMCRVTRAITAWRLLRRAGRKEQADAWIRSAG